MVGSAMSSGALAATRLEETFVNATQDSLKLGLQTHSSFGLQSCRILGRLEAAGTVGGASMSSQMALTRVEDQCTRPRTTLHRVYLHSLITQPFIAHVKA